MSDSEPPTWIFGYGSLIWRTGFTFAESKVGYIKGWTRRFWQGSTDHRGIPDAPGRVVTLVNDAESKCWGMGYKLFEENQADILQRLDHREKGGYERVQTPLYLSDQRVVPTTVYIATPTNHNFLGHAPKADIARQIVNSRGPSGANVEYVLELDRWLKELDVDEPHVRDIANLVRSLQPRV